MRVVRDFPNDIVEIENQWIPMPDGVRLAARIWRPDDAENIPVPAILELIPYRKRDFMRLRDEPIHRYFAGHGYAAVRVDVRGTGDSEGILTDEYTEQEMDDAMAIIAWLSEQAWCDGMVGMTGISWGGFNSLQVAARRPPALKAVITLCAADDRYADDAHYMGGCLLNENMQWGTLFWHLAAYPPDPQIFGKDWRAAWRSRLEALVFFPERWMTHQRRDAYWRHGSVNEDYSAIACPVYAIGGWADGYSNAIPRLMAGLTVPKKGLVGPWAHNFPHDAIPGPSIGYLQEAVAWWDRWLKNDDNGIMDEAGYRVWMQDTVPPAPFHAERPGRWVAEESWPSPRIEQLRFYVNAQALDDVSGVEQPLTWLSPQTTGLHAGNWCGFGSEGEAPLDQRADDGKSLVFDSSPLDAPLEILGSPVVTLDIAVDWPMAFLAVRLNEVAPDGTSGRVSYGLLNLTHRDGHDRVVPLQPDRRYRVAVSLNDIAHVFPAGYRIRLAISTAYWPIAWPSPAPVTLTVIAGAGTLDLPVRPPDPADRDLRAFALPERASRGSQTRLFPMDFKRTIERDLANHETIYTIFSDAGELGGAALARLDAIDLEIGYSLWQQYRIADDDPLSASVEIRQHTQFRRDAWSVRLKSRAMLTADQDYFYLKAEIEAGDGDDIVFVKAWDEKIPRDGI